MRVDGRDITVSGSLLQPLHRRTNDILRLVFAALFLAVVVTSSLVTRNDWVALEKSISDIVGVLTPTQSNLVYLAYGIAILALPFVDPDRTDRRQAVEAARRLRGGRDARGTRAVDQGQRDRGSAMAFRPVRTTQHAAVAVPRRSALDRDARRRPHGVGPMAAVAMAALVVDAAAGVRPHSPRRQRGGTRPVAARPGRWLVRRRVDGARRRHACARGALGRRGPRVGSAKIRGVSHDGRSSRGAGTVGAVGGEPRRRRPSSSNCTDPISAAAEHCGNCGGRSRLRKDETAPLQMSMRRAVEHQALMTIAIGDVGVANSSTLAMATLDRGWTLRAHTPQPEPGSTNRHLGRLPSRGCGRRSVCCTTHRSHTAICAPGDHRPGRQGALRRLRQSRVRRVRRPVPIRHRPAAGDDERTVRRRTRGRRGDRAVR